MKKTVLSIILGLTLSASVFAGDTCVAQKIHDISYGSRMYYRVECAKTGFNTKSIITTFLLPLPYHWGNSARKNLYNEMTKKGYSEVTKFDPYKGSREPIHVFQKEDVSASFCSVILYNEKTIGLKTKSTIYDVIIACGNKPGEDTRFKGLTEKEIVEYMDKLGFRKSLTASAEKLREISMYVYSKSALLIYQDK